MQITLTLLHNSLLPVGLPTLYTELHEFNTHPHTALEDTLNTVIPPPVSSNLNAPFRFYQRTAAQLGYNVRKGTEYFVSLTRGV